MVGTPWHSAVGVPHKQEGHVAVSDSTETPILHQNLQLHVAAHGYKRGCQVCVSTQPSMHKLERVKKNQANYQ
jgi:hypothetical protein